MVFLQFAGQVVITLAAVGVMALRLEHRLTKIETDISWIKSRLNPRTEQEDDYG